MRDWDFIRDEDKQDNEFYKNPYIDYSKLGKVVDGRVTYPMNNLSAESRLIEYVNHEGNSDAQADMAAVSDQITKMKLALDSVWANRTAFKMLSHATQDQIRKVLNR